MVGSGYNSDYPNSGDGYYDEDDGWDLDDVSSGGKGEELIPSHIYHHAKYMVYHTLVHHNLIWSIVVLPSIS